MNDPHIDAIRRFSRFYTRRIGALDDRYLGSEVSLPEGRVIWEMAAGGRSTASDLVASLGLDPGYLSRLLKRLEARGLVERKRSSADGRSRTLSLTPSGRRAFEAIDGASRAQVAAMLSGVSAPAREAVVAAVETIQSLLEGGSEEPITLRDHRPGDMGWVVERHGALYWAEYGWDERFEALVAKIVGDFIENLRPGKERCWIAERGGRRLGCVFLVREDDETARLRLLLVDPAARGHGLGGRLVEACIAFARDAGYRRMTLWTNDVLSSARRIYEAAGFKLVSQGAHHSFGKDLVEQTFDLELGQPRVDRGPA